LQGFLSFGFVPLSPQKKTRNERCGFFCVQEFFKFIEANEREVTFSELDVVLLLGFTCLIFPQIGN